MQDTQWTAEEVWDECNKAGEEAIRSQLIRNQLDGEYRAHAIAWLANVDSEHRATFQAEQLASLHATMDAAETTARMARIAVRDAKRATVIAIVAILVAATALPLAALALIIDRAETPVPAR